MKNRKLVSEFLKTRSEKAFINLYESHTPRLYQIALRLTANVRSDAEDLIQQMWYTAIQKLDSFEWRSELSTWLTGILMNIWREARKKADKEVFMSIEVEGNSSLDEHLPAFDIQNLESAIAQLPAGYRQTIILHDIEGYKHKEIAQIMDISEGTSKSQLYHARKALRAYLKEETQKK